MPGLGELALGEKELQGAAGQSFARVAGPRKLLIPYHQAGGWGGGGGAGGGWGPATQVCPGVKNAVVALLPMPP